MLECRTVSYRIDNQHILRDVNVTLEPGAHLLVHGPSGSGKTTLLSLLAGLIPVTTGTIHYNGVPFHQLSASEVDRFRGSNMGFVFQSHHMVPFLTVEKNLMLPDLMSGKEPEEGAIISLLERLEIGHLLQKKASVLSGGESQRVAIARAVIGRPNWILCDEPTSALDDNSANLSVNLLKAEAEKVGASLIIVTHDSRLKAMFPNDQRLDLRIWEKA
ncbi:ABC transporter ATP-binding protein [Sneathiella sp.]|jgi:ABC-type lipoprotein export system ATPase subunit|uniref:ABC transporter ATP-binding protein n=1 Tax=Sneathiella sp. TaxID=1964365 RepID=UPI0039E721F7